MLAIFGIDFAFLRIGSFRFDISGYTGPTGKYKILKMYSKNPSESNETIGFAITLSIQVYQWPNNIFL